MHLAFSRIAEEEQHRLERFQNFNRKPLTRKAKFALDMETKFYKKALKEYAAEIAEIQEEFPGWLPELD